MRGILFLAEHLALLICQQPSVPVINWQSGRRRAPERYLSQGKSRELLTTYLSLFEFSLSPQSFAEGIPSELIGGLPIAAEVSGLCVPESPRHHSIRDA